MKCRFGYAVINTELKPPNKTIRLKTVQNAEATEPGSGIALLKKLFKDNLLRTLEILKWNVEHNIMFYRMSSNLAPHITNDKLIKGATYKDLAYSVFCARKIGTEIKTLIKKYNMRITFHPDPYTIINGSDEVFFNSKRDLWFHYKLACLLGINTGHLSTTFTLHIGGIYGDKVASTERFIKNFRLLPQVLRDMIVIENDEYKYGIEDVLYISRELNIPMVLDVFHFYVQRTIEQGGNIHDYSERQEMNKELRKFLPHIFATWKGRPFHPKIHISEQGSGRLGCHSEYVEDVPRMLLKSNIDIMVEAKAKEKAVEYLMEKYTSTRS